MHRVGFSESCIFERQIEKLQGREQGRQRLLVWKDKISSAQPSQCKGALLKGAGHVLGRVCDVRRDDKRSNLATWYLSASRGLVLVAGLARCQLISWRTISDKFSESSDLRSSNICLFKSTRQLFCSGAGFWFCSFVNLLFAKTL